MNKKRRRRIPIAFIQSADPEELADMVCDFVKKHKEKQNDDLRGKSEGRLPSDLKKARMIFYGCSKKGRR